MNSPFFSIIIPTYNSAGKLQRALNSVLDQTYTNFEIVIVDGLSKDNTIAIVLENRNKDARINYVSERDNGIYDAMNKGIDMATGKWLYFLGSDDYLIKKNVLQQVANSLQDFAHTFFYGEVLLNGQRYDGQFNTEKLLQKNISHQAIFYSKIIFEKLGYYNTSYKLHADWEFNIRCFLEYEAYAKFEKILIANFEQGGVSAAHDVTFLREFLFPLKLKKLQDSSSALKKIKVFDEYWRLVRNAGINNNQQLLQFAHGYTIPYSIKKMVGVQGQFSPAILRNGFASKFIMFMCYTLHSFSKEK